jgi:hypothetical protein
MRILDLEIRWEYCWAAQEIYGVDDGVGWGLSEAKDCEMEG